MQSIRHATCRPIVPALRRKPSASDQQDDSLGVRAADRLERSRRTPVGVADHWLHRHRFGDAVLRVALRALAVGMIGIIALMVYPLTLLGDRALFASLMVF